MKKILVSTFALTLAAGMVHSEEARADVSNPNGIRAIYVHGMMTLGARKLYKPASYVGKTTMTSNYWRDSGIANTRIRDTTRFANWDGCARLTATTGCAARYGGSGPGKSAVGMVLPVISGACDNPDWCIVVTHSTGSPILGYIGATKYHKVNGWDVPDYNILFEAAAGSAAGGSPAADQIVASPTLTYLFSGDNAVRSPIIYDLQQATIRAKYNHSTSPFPSLRFAGRATRGDWRYVFAAHVAGVFGNNQTDGAVDLNSSAGLANKQAGVCFGQQLWGCQWNVRPSGVSRWSPYASKYGSPGTTQGWWAAHYSTFLDPNRRYNHTQIPAMAANSAVNWLNPQKDAAYDYNEARSQSGQNKCRSDYQCDGLRTCSSSGWCQGSASAGAAVAEASVSARAALVRAEDGANMAPCGTLDSGVSLSAGQSVASCDKRFKLTMQGDGNFVLYKNGSTPIWASNTAGSGAKTVTMKADGNLAVTTPGGATVWASNTAGNAGAALSFDRDGDVVLKSADGIELWDSATPNQGECGLLNPGETLSAGDMRVSCDARFKLVMQNDGNLVLAKASGGNLWSSGTAGSGANKAQMLGDGNFVLTTAGGAVVWSTSTAGHKDAWLEIGNDGDLEVREADQSTLWISSPVPEKECKQSNTMSPNGSLSCDLGSTRRIKGITFSVGCNDGETGTFQVAFDQKEPQDIDVECNTTVTVDPIDARYVSVKMVEGGGPDNILSIQSIAVQHR